MAKKDNLEKKASDSILSNIEKCVSGIYNVVNDAALTITHFIERIGDQYPGNHSAYHYS